MAKKKLDKQVAEAREEIESKALDLKEQLRKKRKVTPIKAEDFVSTGSTVLNLALSGRISGGFVKGKVYRFVGDSGSGKTFLTLTCFAEAMHNKNFEHYRIIHDNPEDGALMDLSAYFGERVAKKIEAPAYAGKEPLFSNTTEELYDHLDKLLDDGRPFIYVLDSMDALDTNAALKKAKKNKAARASGGQEKGSFGDGKAKDNSTNLRRITRKIRKSGSIFIMISQTRDNIGFGSMFNPRTASGGKSLKFFSTIEIWTSVAGQIKKKAGEKDRKIGIVVKLEVQKNRVSGRDWTVYVPILNSVGIDDIGGCVDFLVDEGHWKKKKKKGDKDEGKRKDANKGKIVAPEFGDFEGTKEKLIEKIEESGRERELRLLVKNVFQSLVDQCEVKRKVRYF